MYYLNFLNYAKLICILQLKQNKSYNNYKLSLDFFHNFLLHPITLILNVILWNNYKFYLFLNERLNNTSLESYCFLKNPRNCFVLINIIHNRWCQKDEVAIIGKLLVVNSLELATTYRNNLYKYILLFISICFKGSRI